MTTLATRGAVACLFGEAGGETDDANDERRRKGGLGVTGFLMETAHLAEASMTTLGGGGTTTHGVLPGSQLMNDMFTVDRS